MVEKAAAQAKAPFERPPVRSLAPASIWISFRREVARDAKASRAFAKVDETADGLVTALGLPGGDQPVSLGPQPGLEAKRSIAVASMW